MGISSALTPQPRSHTFDGREWIAREVHDTVGHHVSLIAVQAGTALHVFDKNPENGRRALEAIVQRSRDLLDDLRDVIDVLRGGQLSPPSSVADVARIRQLAADTRSIGLPVTLDVEGAVPALPPSVGAAAHRIVQEALTNVRRHAAASHVRLLVCHERDGLRVQVDDDGSGVPMLAAPEGHGLKGMSERAATVGGSLTAGPRLEGGFRVSAWLPIDESDRRTGTDPTEDRFHEIALPQHGR